MTTPLDKQRDPVSTTVQAIPIEPQASPLSGVTAVAKASAGGGGGPEQVDYWSLKEGGLDPVLGKCIKLLVGKDQDFVVYLDNALSVQWSDRRASWPRAEVLNMVARLQADSSFVTNRQTLQEIRCQIGEGLVRALSEPDSRVTVAGQASQPDPALEILRAAEQWIALENRTLSRRWLAGAASVFGALCAAAMTVIIAGFDLTGWRLVFATAMAGGIGAWVSVLSSQKTMADVDARTGRPNHTFEAFARIMIGVIGALLLALLVQGKFLMSFVTDVTVMLLGFGLVCGASERLLPSLIASVERANEPDAVGNRKEVNIPRQSRGL